MTNARTVLKAATRWLVVLVTSVVLLAPNLFAAKITQKASALKTCCQRCACCIEKSPDQPQVPLAPSSTRTSIDQTFQLIPAAVAFVLSEPAPAVTLTCDAEGSEFSALAPIFLRHCAILI